MFLLVFFANFLLFGLWNFQRFNNIVSIKIRRNFFHSSSCTEFDIYENLNLNDTNLVWRRIFSLDRDGKEKVLFEKLLFIVILMRSELMIGKKFEMTNFL